MHTNLRIFCAAAFLCPVFIGTVARAQAKPGELPLTFVGFEASSEAGDRGLSHLYSGRILAPKGGIATSLLYRASRLPAGWGQIDRLHDPVHQWRRYGFPPSPPARSAGQMEEGRSLPIALSAFRFFDEQTDQERLVVTNSCLACHVSILGGNVVAGAGNSFAYFPPVIEDIDAARRIQTMLRLNPIWRWGTPDSEKAYLGVMIDYFDLVLSPMLYHQRSRGAITGPASTLTYLTRMTTNMAAEGVGDSLRYDTVDLINYDLSQAPSVAPPTKANPWWNIKYKSHLYRYPEEKGESADVMAQHFLDRHIGLGVRPSRRHVAIVKDVLQFAAEMRAPAYPFALDPVQVARGESLFHTKPLGGGGTCSSCHGSYRHIDRGTSEAHLEVDYPEIYLDVGTDRAVFETGRYFMDLVKRRVPASERGDFGTYPNRPGYPAPPLVGIWATAPYFHNGSVPSLYGVLKASARPLRWARSLDWGAYDQRDAGLVLMPRGANLVEGQLYDTNRPGYGNTGHAFADGWDDGSIRDVIAFLQSLND